MDASAILEVTRTLIGATEPYGDSAIDRKRTENLDKLIYVMDELLNDVMRVADSKDRYEASMQMMGEKATKTHWLAISLCYCRDASSLQNRLMMRKKGRTVRRWRERNEID